jgi:hypothetical protein
MNQQADRAADQAVVCHCKKRSDAAIPTTARNHRENASLGSQ